MVPGIRESRSVNLGEGSTTSVGEVIPQLISGATSGDATWAADLTQNDLLDAIHVVARHVTRQGPAQNAT